MSDHVKRGNYLKYLKISTVFISILFLIFTFHSNYQDVKDVKIVSIKASLAYIIGLALLYMMLLSLLALSWKWILESLSKASVLYKIVFIYLKTMIFKYVPGNVFHYVARQVEAKKEGISHKNLIQSNVIEAVVMISASLATMSFALMFIENIAIDSYVNYLNMSWVYGIGISGILLIFFISKYNGLNANDYIRPLFLYIMFFLGIGFITYVVTNEVLHIKTSISICVFLYTAAWLVGFITPGAPGGLGVRESLFIILSNGLLDETDALIVSALLRIVTILGEVLAFILASLIIKNMSSGLNNSNDH